MDAVLSTVPCGVQATEDAVDKILGPGPTRCPGGADGERECHDVDAGEAAALPP